MANLTPALAARMLNVSRSRVQKLLKDGRIPGAFQIKIGNVGHWAIPQESLTEIRPPKGRGK
jgi:excisionase family DNA binding protein